MPEYHSQDGAEYDVARVHLCGNLLKVFVGIKVSHMYFLRTNKIHNS